MQIDLDLFKRIIHEGRHNPDILDSYSVNQFRTKEAIIEHVEMLNIGYGGTKIYNFDDMENVLMKVKNLNVTIKSQKNGYRQIGIEGTSPKNNKTKGLFQIRLRREPEAKPGVPIKYIRNLIEKNKLLGELLAESLD